MSIDDTLDKIEEIEERLTSVHDDAMMIASELTHHRKSATITIRIAKDTDTTLSAFSEYDGDDEEAPFHEETFRLSEMHTRSFSVGDHSAVASLGDVEWEDEE